MKNFSLVSFFFVRFTSHFHIESENQINGNENHGDEIERNRKNINKRKEKY
jgi:hypothetical protein